MDYFITMTLINCYDSWNKIDYFCFSFNIPGTVPGPVIFGAIIDKTCLVWEEDECDDTRTCWIYDNGDLALYSFLMLAALRILSIIFLIGTLMTYKPSLDAVEGDEDKLAENTSTKNGSK